MKLFDSHAHIGAPELLADAPALIARARDAGVEGMLAIGAGYGVGANAGAVMLAQEQAGVWAAVGVHPHDADEWSELAATALDGWLAAPRVVAVGECGLDYFYEHSRRGVQREALAAQIGIARAARRPLVIHVRPSRGSRDAFDELIEIFDRERAHELGGVIHCFTGDLPFARACLERDFDISFSGILTFKNADELRDVARALPLERLMIETDTPLLAPTPHRGKRNEPAWVARVAECLAEVHGVSPAEVAERTASRARARFQLGAPG
ncbi:MAG TPA: TatD family hydrolase [Myxococcota bacterium]|nr:TatD family hydrolase [Myxococcota bacterium]